MERRALEPWLADMVEAAIAPYRGRLPEADVAWMGEQLARRLQSDPDMARMANDARERAPTDESGKLLRRDVLDGVEDPTSAGDGARAAGGDRRDR